MNAQASRLFEPVVLGTDGPEPPPELVASLLVLRSDKAVRRLAKVAAYQQRFLCDISGFEHFLSSAALKAIEGTDPVAWLEAQVHNIKREQVATRSEHARMAERIAGLAEKGEHRQSNANLSSPSRQGEVAFDRGVLP